MNYKDLAEEFAAMMKSHGKKQMMHRFNTMAQGEPQVLFYLLKNEGEQVVPSDIAKFTATSTARIATILNSLEDKALITREISKQDRRKILVAITPKGIELAETKRDEMMGILALSFEAMGEERAGRFIEDLKLFLLSSNEILENLAENCQNELEKEDKK